MSDDLNKDQEELDENNESNEDESDIEEDDSIEIDDIDSDSIEDIVSKIKEKGQKPIVLSFGSFITKKVWLELLIEASIFSVMLFTLNYFFNVFNLNLLIQVSLYFITYVMGFCIHYFLKKKIMMIYVFSFGVLELLINGIIYAVLISILNSVDAFTINNTFLLILAFIIGHTLTKLVVSYIGRKISLLRVKKDEKK